jgi:hypothetical protein
MLKYFLLNFIKIKGIVMYRIWMFSLVFMLSACVDNTIKGANFSELKVSVFELTSDLDEQKRSQFIGALTAIIRNKTKHLSGEPDINTLAHLNGKNIDNIVTEWEALEFELVKKQKDLIKNNNDIEAKIIDINDQIESVDSKPTQKIEDLLLEINLLEKKISTERELTEKHKKNQGFAKIMTDLMISSMKNTKEDWMDSSNSNFTDIEKVFVAEGKRHSDLMDEIELNNYKNIPKYSKSITDNYLNTIANSDATYKEKFIAISREATNNLMVMFTNNENIKSSKNKVSISQSEILKIQENIENEKNKHKNPLISLKEKLIQKNETLAKDISKLNFKLLLLKSPIVGI